MTQSAWVPATQVGDPAGVLASGFGLVYTQFIAGIWQVNSQVEDHMYYSLCLSLPAFQVSK